jgi:hypothetical protein
MSSDGSTSDEYVAVAAAPGCIVASWRARLLDGGTGDYDVHIYATTSTDGGATWSTPAVVYNELMSLSKSSNIQPEVAADTYGNGVVVWSAGFLNGAPKDDDIYAAHTTNFGATWSNEVSVNNYADTETDYDLYPIITTDGSGRWFAAWRSGYELNGIADSKYDLLYATSTDNGATWTDARYFNDRPATGEVYLYTPVVASDMNGTWFFGWKSTDTRGGTIGSDNDVIYAMDSLALLDDDGDGLTNAAEVSLYGTNPNLADSDSDGVDDPVEIALDTDPTNGSEYPNLSELWVQFNYVSSPMSGTFANPLNVLETAITYLADGGTIQIRGDTGDPDTTETFSGAAVISKPMTIQAYSGTVTIGAP